MGDLTKNFSRSEFACKCGCGLDAIDLTLVLALQGLRNLISKDRRLDTPLIINSGCRCWPHHQRECRRAKLPVTKRSQHLPAQGCCAADVASPSGMSPRQLANYARRISMFQTGGIIVYPWGCHLDTRKTKPYFEIKPGVPE